MMFVNAASILDVAFLSWVGTHSGGVAAAWGTLMVWRCRLKPIKPELNAPGGFSS